MSTDESLSWRRAVGLVARRLNPLEPLLKQDATSFEGHNRTRWQVAANLSPMLVSMEQ